MEKRYTEGMIAETENLENISKTMRFWSLKMTTEAGSGHPTSCLSASDLMTALMFGGNFKFDINNPKNPANDRLIFSKGHASALFYALWAATGGVSYDQLPSYRQFGSPLEGHPTSNFSFTEAATGSLGQGLSIGAGIALNSKNVDKIPHKTYVLLGDSEFAEGSVKEAMEFASYYKLDNLIGILDINRLGQRGEAMYGHNVEKYAAIATALGWQPIVIDGHDFTEIQQAYKKAVDIKTKPVMIVAETKKGKGISFLEDKDGWHGKTLSEEELGRAIDELGMVDQSIPGRISVPEIHITSRVIDIPQPQAPIKHKEYQSDDLIATRKAYGQALIKAIQEYPNIVVLDAEVSNSTFAQDFKGVYPQRFFETFIAEQNMAGVGLGLSTRDKIVFMSTFAAFWTRSFDQLRMSALSNANIKVVGSHAGVAIGEDGPSQMGLEDIAMMRSIFGSNVLYPSDAVSMEKIVLAVAGHFGIDYIRTTRSDTPVIYDQSEEFPIGGSKVLRQSARDKVTIIGAGITLHEAISAHKELAKENINSRIIDLYSIKPFDEETLLKAAKATGTIITVEDHYPQGGIGEAVSAFYAENRPTRVVSLAARKRPMSGKAHELLDFEEISAKAIYETVKKILSK